MRKPMLALLIIFIITLIFRPEPARAVECVGLAHQLPKLDTVVDARIREIPATGRVRLDVMTYYKGTGGPSLEAEVFGLGVGDRMDWNRTPRRGDRVLIGFVRKNETLWNEICQPLIVLGAKEPIPADISALLGPGRPTGIAAEAPPQTPWLLIGGLGAAGLGIIWYIRRPRQ